MYITIEQTVTCSKCNDANNYEDVWFKGTQSRRCRSCGHEKITATVTTTSNSEEGILYQMSGTPMEETF